MDDKTKDSVLLEIEKVLGDKLPIDDEQKKKMEIEEAKKKAEE